MAPGPPHILIVDDDPHVCEMIHNALSYRGFDCASAVDAARARQLLDRRRFDLLIANITMPAVSGLDLPTYVRRASPHCKVLLITGFSTRDGLAQALVLGAYDYLGKPFSMDRLAEVVERALTDGDAVPELTARAAAAMELSSQSRQAALDSVRALARAVEAKDPYTRRHSEHVTHYAVQIARHLGESADAIESIRVASLLHDIGKIGVPDSILTKPGKLTDEEFEHIRRHPALGADIIANITLFRREGRLVRHHHERWDGRGYPDGLAGEEIPFGARIINVADSMDAMLMKRTYKTALPPEQMLGELTRCGGSQFDPRIAAAAFEWFQADPERLILPGREASRLAI